MPHALPGPFFAVVLIAMLALAPACDVFDEPAKDLAGRWTIDQVITREYVSDGTLTRDETARDLGILDLQRVESGRDQATAPQAFIDLFLPFVLLKENLALTVFDDRRVGSQWAGLDQRIAFGGVGANNRGQNEFSYVATTVLNGNTLTLLYVQNDNPPNTFYMSLRQEVTLTRASS